MKPKSEILRDSRAVEQRLMQHDLATKKRWSNTSWTPRQKLELGKQLAEAVKLTKAVDRYNNNHTNELTYSTARRMIKEAQLCSKRKVAEIAGGSEQPPPKKVVGRPALLTKCEEDKLLLHLQAMRKMGAS